MRAAPLEPAHGMPSTPSLARLSWRPVGAPELATSAVALRKRVKQAAALHKSLQKDWSAKHRTILHHECAALPPARNEADCRDLGVCVCSAVGKQAHAMRAQLESSDKNRWPHAQGEWKQLASQGKWALLLRSEDPGAVVADPPSGSTHLTNGLRLSERSCK